MDKELKKFVIQGLRRHSYKWKPRNEAKKLARVERNQYKCAICKKLFTNDQIKIDHIIPVIDPNKGFTSWDDYIERMFCPIEGFQILCKEDHDRKTWDENSQRSESRSKKKGKKVNDIN